MGQLGFFDADKRLAALSAKGDPLEAIDRLVPWENFRADIEAVVLTPDEMRKSSAGRRPVYAIVMLRMLVLQALHNLSDEQAEYQVRDRLSFMTHNSHYLDVFAVAQIASIQCGSEAMGVDCFYGWRGI